MALCLWNFWECFQPNNYLIIKILIFFQSRYVTSMYFIFTALTSVGFGNVAPNSVPEKIYSIIVMLVGCKYHSPAMYNVAAGWLCATFCALRSLNWFMKKNPTLSTLGYFKIAVKAISKIKVHPYTNFELFLKFWCKVIIL